MLMWKKDFLWMGCSNINHKLNVSFKHSEDVLTPSYCTAGGRLIQYDWVS